MHFGLINLIKIKFEINSLYIKAQTGNNLLQSSK